ncbi:MAG: YfcE family phosphodiesterase [Oscillospiraceae bacterium]|nr:YfcE family phosphodiesterase [Oscillospiraceae bacterium]
MTVISDTHGNYRRLKSVIEQNTDSNLFIHCGDGLKEAWRLAEENPHLNFVFVKGNCDYQNYTEENMVEVSGHRIFYTHGHNYHVRRSHDGVVKRAKSLQCTIALYGHTHVHETSIVSGIHVMNSGSVDSPREGNCPTYGVIMIDDDSGVSMEIVECGSRQ